MADDIDIEEHDVLDNPVIKYLFPDLSVLKQEISQYEELDIKSEPILEVGRPFLEHNMEDSMEQAMPDTPEICGAILSNVSKEADFCNNVIILGSKPAASSKEKDHKEKMVKSKFPKVMLKNIRPYLEKSKKYCKKCCILYHNISALNFHVQTKHNHVNDVKVTKLLSSDKSTKTKFKCALCSTFLSNRPNLVRHIKNIHKKRKNGNANNKLPTMEKNKPSTDSHDESSASIVSELDQSKFKCDMCSTFLSNRHNLIRHIKNIHKNADNANRLQTREKDKASIESHDEISTGIVSGLDQSHLCFHCQQSFPDKNSLVEHLYSVLEPKKDQKKIESKTPNEELSKNQNLVNHDKRKMTDIFNSNESVHQGQDSSSTEAINLIKLRKTQRNLNSLKRANKRVSDEFGSANGSVHQDHDSVSKEDTNVTERRKKRKPAINDPNIEVCDEFESANESVYQDYDSDFKQDTNMNKCRKKRRTGINDLKPEHIEDSDEFESANELVHQDQDRGSKKYKNINKRRKMETTNANKLNPVNKEYYNEKKRKISEKFKGTVVKDAAKKIINGTNNKVDKDYISTLNMKNTSEKLNKTIFNKKTSTHNHDKKTLVENAYKCQICPRYDFTFKSYAKHMIRNHNMKKVPKTKKVKFNPECIFCTSKLVNINSYNLHLSRYHEDKLFIDYRMARAGHSKELETEVSDISVVKPFAFKSVLYKCAKCDIHFLNVKSASNHTQHMEIMLNWKCLICNRIFKKVDKILHVKQHTYSHSFTVNDLYETSSNQVLYNCQNCTIHFNESSYLRHFAKCEDEPPNSTYCKVCDILVDQRDFDVHDKSHKIYNFKLSDFIIVNGNLVIYEERDVNIPDNEKNNLVSNQIVHDKSRFLMTFCQKCECFVSTMGSTRKVHIEARCSHMPRRVCRVCGLVFTDQTIRCHKMVHNKIKGLSVQNYYFYDMKSKKQICPPVPEYPSCNVCGIHFITKNDVLGHECSGFAYVTCKFCKLKFSEPAMKLHIQFHQYSIKKLREPISPEISDSTLDDDMLDSINVEEPNAELPNACTRPTILYTCKSCHTAFDNYDDVIEHCQSHYDQTKPRLYLKRCQKCNLLIDVKHYKSHTEMHSSSGHRSKAVKILDFDPIYYPFENSIWMKHISGPLPDDAIKFNQLINESIYRTECRIKMEIEHNGTTDLTFYRCDKCLAFVDANCLYNHSSNLQCNSLRQHHCAQCGMSVVSVKHKIEHEKIHKNADFNIKNCRLVKFNMDKDQTYHNTIFKSPHQFTLYQCRNCYMAMDKFQREIHLCNVDKFEKCVHCGLLVRREDKQLHYSRHEQLDDFNSNHIMVVLFGKDLNKEIKRLKPSFHGTIIDYTFYKCIQCELCFRTKNFTVKHKCAVTDGKYQCPQCYLYLFKEEKTSHALLHETESELNEYNLNIITFDVNLKENNDKHEIKFDKEDEPSQLNASALALQNNENSEKPKKLVFLYKCDCSLHFLDETKYKTHISHCTPRMKISRQNCSKCGLMFTPEELFNHLLAHHADKQQECKFEMANLSKLTNIGNIYKCEKCSIHFLKESEINDHIEKCNVSEISISINRQECNACGLLISSLSFLTNDHENNCLKKYKIKIVDRRESKESNSNVNKNIAAVVSEQDMVFTREYNLSSDILSKLDLCRYSNYLYNCSVCNVCFLTDSTWTRHLRSNKKYRHATVPTEYCDICELKFSLLSLAKHKYIHHYKFNLKKDDIVIKYSKDLKKDDNNDNKYLEET